ncbi:Shugoshin [Macleaya cordata]|uniref:Shugoshin n=1 Tax=Macleaya cordata TaxID=56857 RepID=A0A200R5K5_MACCD|nr:Shugoshin [Macleaya cordata]
MNGERLPKKPSLGSVVRKRLSDITNSLSSPNQDEKTRFVSSSAKDYIEQLHKCNCFSLLVVFSLLKISSQENMALMRLLAERNKIIELTGVELTKMRVNLQKLQQQNWHLAQANSKMLVEVNIGKDRLKAMQHELGCRNALIKSLEHKEMVTKGPCQKAHTEEGLKKPEEVKGTSNRNRRRQSRIHSPGSSAGTEQVAMEDKADDKRQSAVSKSEQPESAEEKADNKRLCLRRQSTRFKSEVPETTDEKADEADNKRLCLRRQSTRFKSEVPEPTDEKADEADNKRLCLRRQSTRFKSEVAEPTNEKADDKRLRLRRHSTRLQSKQPEPTEDLFEIEDTKFPVSPLLDEPMQENGPTSSNSSTIKEENNGRSSVMCDTPESRRSSIARPMRRAAVKVQSYKEVPVNVKMRRSE